MTSGRQPVSVSFGEYSMVARAAMSSIFTYFQDQPEAARSTNRRFATVKNPTGKTFERLALDPVLRRLSRDDEALCDMAAAMNLILAHRSSVWTATQVNVWCRPPEGKHQRGHNKKLQQKFGDKVEPFYDFWVEVHFQHDDGSDTVCIPINAKWGAGNVKGRSRKSAQRTSGGAALLWLLSDNLEPQQIKSAAVDEVRGKMGWELRKLERAVHSVRRRARHKRPRDYHILAFQRSNGSDHFCSGMQMFSYLTVDPYKAFTRTASAGFPHLQADFSSPMQNVSAATADERLLGFLKAFCERELAAIKGDALLAALGKKVQIADRG